MQETLLSVDCVQLLSILHGERESGRMKLQTTISKHIATVQSVLVQKDLQNTMLDHVIHHSGTYFIEIIDNGI